MAKIHEEEQARRRRDNARRVLDLDHDRFEVWRHFEERADRLGERLWSTGVWLMSILAVTLTLSAHYIEIPGALHLIQLKERLPLAALAAFGMAFCVYSYQALNDLREHIESNWYKSSYVLEGDHAIEWGGRKQHGWNILLGVGSLAFLTFAGLLILTVFLP